MRQTVMDGDTPFLPQEIITDILIRLPVKSLIRFQCVSKQWKTLIKTPSFIAEHLHHHSSDHNSCLLLQRNRRDDPMHLYLLNRELEVLEFLKTDDLSCAKIIGSSDGLLCVEIDEYDNISPSSLFLLNPATREIREVPRTRTIDDFEGKCTLGFGFCPIVKDYKIVRTYASQFHTEVNQVEMYSLRTGSWTEIELGNLEPVSLFWETVTVNGAIFWAALKVEDYDKDDVVVVVSFDIAMEVFTLMPGPALENNSTDKLAVYDNKLAIISLTVNGIFGICESSFVDLWVMEEGTNASGGTWTWTKKYKSATYPSYFLNPATLWGNDVVCSVTKCEGKNQKPKTKNGLGMFIIRGCVHGIFNYVESLVSPICRIENPRC